MPPPTTTGPRTPSMMSTTPTFPLTRDTLSHSSLTPSPSQRKVESQLQEPLAPRYPLTPQLAQQITSSDTFASILRRRGALYRDVAMSVLDARGKEVSAISWDRLLARAESIGLYLQNKLRLVRGDRVCLIFRNEETLEFTPALMACFMAGYVAVPIPHYGKEKDIFEIMNQAVSEIALMSDSASRRFDTLKETMSGHYPWPQRMRLLKASSLSSSKVFVPAVHDLAYIEFSKAPNGEHTGVVLSHKTLLHQMHTIETILKLRPGAPEVHRSIKVVTRARQVLLSTLSPLSSVGLILGCLFPIYTGNALVWAPSEVMEVPGLYANIITRLKVTGLLADYIGLKEVIFDYQRRPNETRTFNKMKVDLSSVIWCLVNASIIDGEFLHLVLERWLRPLGYADPQNCVCPMLTLSDFGGMVIAMRDWLRPVVDHGSSSDLSEVMIDRRALSLNVVKIVSSKISPTQKDTTTALRIGSFGFPIPDATLAIVNPETNILASQMEVGEIWIDSMCLSGGLFEGYSPKVKDQNKAIFNATCSGENGPLAQRFLRTGLLGFTHDGKLYVVGLYEDRIRQHLNRAPLTASREADAALDSPNLTTYHYTHHLSSTVAEKVREVYDCTFFDININDEYLPIAIVETPITESFISSAELLLDALDGVCLKVYEVSLRTHLVHLYCVVATEKNELPRIQRSGGLEIANMMSKKLYQEGNLRKVHFVKFTFTESPRVLHDDIVGGIWSPYSSTIRGSRVLLHPCQVSRIDYRAHTHDARFQASLMDFKSILDILKFRFGCQGDEVAFHYIGLSEKDNVRVTWKKLEGYIQGVVTYLLTKTTLKPGHHVVLMYTLSIEYIVAVYACFTLGLIPIPITPFDSQRLKDEYPAFLATLKNFNVRALLIDDDIERSFKFHNLGESVKRTAPSLLMKSTTKLHKTKVMHAGKLHAMIADFQGRAKFRDESTMCLVWLNQDLMGDTTMNHKCLMSMCKILKETFNMGNTPMLGCVRHSAGLGFLQSVLMGVFLGSTTYLLSPVTFRDHPLSLFMVLSKYKVRDTFVTNNMLVHAMTKVKPGAFKLHGLKNMMVYDEGRTNPIDLEAVARHFSPSGLGVGVVSSIYSHPFNPFVSSRSAMAGPPIPLFLDPNALSRGMVELVSPSSYHITVRDSGVVPVCTEVAIVNPETCKLCREGEIGEIWVCSEATATSLTNGPLVPKDYFRLSQLNGKIVDGNPNMTYLRTGDLGFLYATEGLQPLYILGSIGDTFESQGLHHFSFDVEHTISGAHRKIFRCGVFRCNRYVIAVVETDREPYPASLVPVIVNLVYAKHRLVVDIVSFVAKDALPLSLLRVLQRGKIVKSYIGKEREANRIPLLVSYGINRRDETELASISSRESAPDQELEPARLIETHSLGSSSYQVVPLEDASEPFVLESSTPSFPAASTASENLHTGDGAVGTWEGVSDAVSDAASDAASDAVSDAGSLVELMCAGPTLAVINT